MWNERLSVRKIQTSVSENKGKGHINADGVCGFFAKATKSIGPGKNSKPLHPKSLVLHMVEERAFPTQMPLPSNGHGQLKSEVITGKVQPRAFHWSPPHWQWRNPRLPVSYLFLTKPKSNARETSNVTLRSKGSFVYILYNLDCTYTVLISVESIFAAG